MKPNEQIVGEAVRIEFEEKTGKLYLVFEIKEERFKQNIKKDWIKDIELRLVDKYLIEENE